MLEGRARGPLPAVLRDGDPPLRGEGDDGPVVVAEVSLLGALLALIPSWGRLVKWWHPARTRYLPDDRYTLRWIGIALSRTGD